MSAPFSIVSEVEQPNSGGGHQGTPSSAVVKPTTIFRRSDTPFLGGGTEVMLSEEPGYTKQGWLGVPFRFQVPPVDNWQKTRGASWPGFMVLGGEDGPRERARPEGKKLQVVTFKAMFLTWEPEWQVWSPDELEPLLACGELEALCAEKIKFRLRIRNSAYYDYDDVNMIAVLTQADVTEEAGEMDTRYVQLSFQEWEPSKQEAASVKASSGPWTFSPSKKDTHTSMYTLAQKYYKSAAKWRMIANANPALAHVPPSSAALYNAMGGHTIKIPSPPAPGDTTGSAAGEAATTVISL